MLWVQYRCANPAYYRLYSGIFKEIYEHCVNTHVQICNWAYHVCFLIMKTKDFLTCIRFHWNAGTAALVKSQLRKICNTRNVY